MTFDSAIEVVVQGFEIFGVGILIAGSIVALVVYAIDLRRLDRRTAYRNVRGNVGRTILLGLEVLIIADIVLTVAIDQTIESAATLGLIVLVRTFLSISLDIELDGVAPWHRREAEAAGGPQLDDPI